MSKKSADILEWRLRGIHPDGEAEYEATRDVGEMTDYRVRRVDRAGNELGFCLSMNPIGNNWWLVAEE